MPLQDVLGDLVNLIDIAKARGTINTPHGYLYVIKAEELDAWIEKVITDAENLP